MPDPFFMVARCDAGAFDVSREWLTLLTLRAAPRYVHATRGSAESEAERLALLNPDREYAVLECVAVVSSREYPVAGRTWRVPVYERAANDR